MNRPRTWSTAWHVYQILINRHERMLEFMLEPGRAPEHVWIGVTVEEAAYKNRINVLRKVPCKVRFVSIEPVIGPVGGLDMFWVSGVIVGGESGPNHWPIRAEWVREIRDQCSDLAREAFETCRETLCSQPSSIVRAHSLRTHWTEQAAMVRPVSRPKSSSELLYGYVSL